MLVPYVGDALLPDLELLAAEHANHSHETAWWQSVSERHARSREALRMHLVENRSISLSPVGDINFELFEFSDTVSGISTVDLFGLDELILLAFYWTNRARYRRVADLGANVGLHSIVLAKLGYRVRSFEPDSLHAGHMQLHVAANGVASQIDICQAAVAEKSGNVEFVRVLGNTTGSHVLGSKAAPYGNLEQFTVESVSIHEAIEGADLVKMDVEGSEGKLLHELFVRRPTTVPDILCEVGSQANARLIWSSLRNTQYKIFSQKIGWSAASNVDDLPLHHTQGSIFVSSKEEMPWSRT